MTASVIHALNESDSRLHKEEVIRKTLVAAQLGSTTAQIFLGLARATYDAHITWGVKSVPATDGITGAENPWVEFNAMLTALHERKLTGNRARDAIASMSQRFDSDEWNTFCAPVLRKDLRAGISEKTLNRVLRGTEWEVPVFGCQLATDCTDRPEMRGLKRLEPKLDGVRVLMLLTVSEWGSSVVSYSRNGRVFENFRHIEDELAAVLERIAGKVGHTAFVLDGEVVGASFQDLMRQARRKTDVDSDDTVFHVFDFIPFVDFMRGYWNAPLKARLGALNSFRGQLERCPHVELLPHHDVDLDTAAGRDQFDRYCRDTVAAGFEGVMIKSLDAPYECKRTTFWLKYKPTITVDLEVIDVEEGTGRNSGRLGALVCSGSDHGRTITVNVGSGYSDVDRDDLWRDRAVVVGRPVEVLADAVTQNADGTWSLRFPRFLRFRDALTGEKE